VTVDVDRMRHRLEEERERTGGAIDYLRREHPGSMEDEVEEMPLGNHMADMASVTIDREIDYSLQANEQRRLADIDAALRRIDGGTYGRCEACGSEIEEERLEAVPWTRLCIDDARKAEAG